MGSASATAADCPSTVDRSWRATVRRTMYSTSGREPAAASRTPSAPCFATKSAGSKPCGMIITTACTGYVSWNAYARSAARAPASSESNARIARCANRLSRRKCASPSAVPHVATAFSMPACTRPITSVYPSTT